MTKCVFVDYADLVCVHFMFAFRITLTTFYSFLYVELQFRSHPFLL